MNEFTIMVLESLIEIIKETKVASYGNDDDALTAYKLLKSLEARLEAAHED